MAGSKHQHERSKYLQHLEHDGANTGGDSGEAHAFETTPLFSLAVKYAGSKVYTEDEGVDIRRRPVTRSSGHKKRQDDSSDGSMDETPDESDDESDSSDSSDDSYDSDTDDPPTANGPSNNEVLSQYGLLGFHIGEHPDIDPHEPIMLNTRAPNSTFLCGSQGSGKSFTLGCILETYLRPDPKYGSLANPVAGIAFHYDNDETLGGAEVASLCSRGIKVNVLVPSSNYAALNAAYQRIAKEAGGKVQVDRLLLQDNHLSINRMHRLMAFDEESSSNGVPLYIASLNNILLNMAIQGRPFRLDELEKTLLAEDFAPAQRNMLNMRLNLLRTFVASHADRAHRPNRDLFKIAPGTLTIVDLSDPFIDTAMVCTLFDITLGLFKSNRPADGLIITLDEAHKYMNDSASAMKFTEHLITTIRMQRHHATRVVIATQEPTISGSLLDLCSVSIVHRFSSPAWFQAIKEHLSAASSLVATPQQQKALFDAIVNLKTGQSFVFSPASFLCMEDGKEKLLGTGVMKMKTRKREGVDLGRSKLAGEGVAQTSRVNQSSGKAATQAVDGSHGRKIAKMKTKKSTAATQNVVVEKMAKLDIKAPVFNVTAKE